MRALLAIALLAVVGGPAVMAAPADARVLPERDFTIRIDAGNAVLQEVPGSPGATEVLLRGVAPRATVTYVARPRHQYRIPIEHVMRYWTAYGDVSGQFRTDPPIGAIRRRANGAAAPDVFALRGGRWEGAPGVMRFRVGPAERAKARALTTRMARGSAFASGRGVQVHIDMPDRPRQGASRRPGARENGWMTCNGVYSDQLLACSTPTGPPASWRLVAPNNTYCELPAGLSANSPIFIYSVVGIVSYANSFGPGGIATPAGVPFCGMSPLSGFGGPATFGWGTWYGVSPGWITYYTASRCNYFLAAWSAGGGCY